MDTVLCVAARENDLTLDYKLTKTNTQLLLRPESSPEAFPWRPHAFYFHIPHFVFDSPAHHTPHLIVA